MAGMVRETHVMSIFLQFYDSLMETKASQRDEEVLRRYTLPHNISPRSPFADSVL